MRDKERLQDYRFMPEPNLPSLYLYDNSTAAQSRDKNTGTTNIDEEIQNMPPLPRDVRNKLINDYNLSLRNVYVLVVIIYQAIILICDILPDNFVNFDFFSSYL